jgi:hypothetical protein
MPSPPPQQFVKYITACVFVKNGKFVVVGTYSGRCFFYSTDVGEG